MSKSTPGPWRVDDTKALGAYGVWTDYPTHPGHDGAGYESQICSMLPTERKDREQRDADAALIAAAPDLLATCKRMVDVLATNSPGAKKKAREDEIQAAWEQCVAAIAKAEQR